MGNIGANITRLREAAGLSIRELARRANCSDSHLSGIERGDVSQKDGLSERLKRNLAGALGVTVAELEGRGLAEIVQELVGAMGPEAKDLLDSLLRLTPAARRRAIADIKKRAGSREAGRA